MTIVLVKEFDVIFGVKEIITSRSFMLMIFIQFGPFEFFLLRFVKRGTSTLKCCSFWSRLRFCRGGLKLYACFCLYLRLFEVVHLISKSFSSNLSIPLHLESQY